MVDEGRIRELVELIESEKDPAKVALLAAELERLLSKTPDPPRED